MAEYKLDAPPANPRAASRQLSRGGSSSSIPFDDAFSPRPETSFPAMPTGVKSALKKAPGGKRDVRVNFPAKLDTVICRDAGENGADDGESYTLYQTLYAYHSDDPEDLHFEANEILQVTDDGDGTEHTWFYGRRQDGKQGHFPGTYVRKIQLHGKRGLSIDMEAGGKAKVEIVKPTKELQSHEYVLYSVLYDYTASGDDELSLAAGEILRVTEEGATKDEWFFGQNQDGKEGYFPGTYIRKIPMQSGRKVSIEGLEHT